MVECEFNTIENFGCHSLIVCASTGIYWTHQYDHHGCAHSSVEGFPLFIDAFGIYNPCDWLGRYNNEELKNEADIVNESLLKYKDNINKIIKRLEFNYEKIYEFREGFIPVKIFFEKYVHKYDGEPDYPSKEGYLMLDNCD